MVVQWWWAYLQGFEQELAEIKEATLRLSEQVTSKPHPPQEGGAAPPTTSANLGSSQTACGSEVTRLIEERDALLQTGEGEGLGCGGGGVVWGGAGMWGGCVVWGRCECGERLEYVGRCWGAGRVCGVEGTL